MKNLRCFLSLALALSMLLALNMTALAAEDTGYTDVAPDAWYAGAVAYVTENGLMNGTGTARFAPNEETNLAMVITILHRDAGTPAASTPAPGGATGWYADAAAWANEQGLLADVNGTFTGAPITREDMVTVLWRYAGSPTGNGEDFADEAEISAYAARAVDWSQANGIVNGKPGNLFDPKGGTTRAELAAILQRFMTLEPSESAPETSAADGKILVVYFSMPETTDPNNMTTEEDNSTVVINGEVLGNTQYMAYVIQDTLGADIFRIEPEVPYPTDHTTLVAQAREEQSQSYRPAIQGAIENLEDYDTIFLGYPNWWGDMPMILYSFLEQYDFGGKTIVPFNTHGGSGFSSTISTIRSLEPEANVLDGLSISRNAIQDAEQEIVDWVGSLDI